MKNLFILALIILCKFSLFAQQSTISGFIRDSSSLEKLIQAGVYEMNNQAGMITNNYGFYSLTIPNGPADLRVSYVGYNDKTTSFYLTKDTIINIDLISGSFLKEIVIFDKKEETAVEKVQMSQITVPVKQIKAVPAFLGETDVIKVLQLLPGVKSGGEGQTGLYVRGGSPDQNLILLDGVPVYNINHVAGFFSVFNADAINNVTLTKGGFPARYGGRLSSIIDISLKEGNMKEFHGDGSFGLISSKLTLEGPIIKDKSSFMISGRRTYLDLLMNPFIRASNSSEYKIKLKLNFYDLNAKVNYVINDKNRIYLSAYSGNDVFGIKDKSTYEDSETKSNSGINWGNITTALRWNRIVNSKIFTNLTATFSQYNFSFGSEYEENIQQKENYFLSKYTSGIRDFAIRYAVDHVISPKHYVRYGASATNHKYNPGIFQTKINNDGSDLNTVEGSSKANSIEYSAYVEDEIKLGRWNAMAGLNFSAFQLLDENNKFYTSLEPRLGLNYRIAPDINAKASLVWMKQYINLLTNEGIGLPSDLWVPSTGTIKPQKSWQAAAGVAINLWKDYELTVEGFYKEMKNVISYKQDASFLNINDDWQDKVTQGQGWAYGLEILLQKKYGKLSGWLGYSLAWNHRKFEELNLGKKFPFKFDRRHDISITASYELSKRIQFSGTWVYNTGNAITLPENEFPTHVPGSTFPGFNEYYDHLSATDNYSSRNNFRMPSYHRLDLSISFVKQKPKSQRKFILGCYNVYNRINPFAVTDIRKTTDNKTKVSYIGIFPIIPSFSYQLKF